MELTRKKGKVVLVGDVGLGLQRDPLYKKEIDFLISCSYGPGRYDPSYELRDNDYPYAYVRWTENRNMQAVVKLIESEKLNLRALLPDTFCLEEASHAYQRIREKKSLGAVLYYHESDEFCDTSGRKEEAKLSKLEYKKSEFIEDKSYPTMFVPAQKAGLLRVGIIGVGGFAKVKLLPILSELKQTKLDAIVDVNTANALTVARQYKAAHVLADDQELFENDLIDVAVIASPHLFHADQALRALKSGKAVFLEKPMVTNIEQLNEFKKLLRIARIICYVLIIIVPFLRLCKK